MKIALVGCSDPRPENRREELKLLTASLVKEGIDVVVSPLIFAERVNQNGEDAVIGGERAAMPVPDNEETGVSIFAEETAKKKAAELMRHFADPEVDFIFDVSGGNLANSVLPYLDFQVIRESRAVFTGYSDLTTVLNAIAAKSGRSCINYQIRNLMHGYGEIQKKYLLDKILRGKTTKEDLEAEFLRGSAMQGKMLGGNIRCLLKLAGTEYWPDMQGAILLLEAYSGDPYAMTTALHQLKQMGIFEQVSGVLLGTFTEMDVKKHRPAMEELVLEIVPDSIPVAKTRWIGHGHDARAIVIGRQYSLKRE